MFNSIFQNGTTIGMIALMTGLALLCGILYAWIVSRKLRSSKGMYITLALIPMIVGIGIALLSKFMGDSDASGGVTRIATIAIALGLLRFRSNNGRAEEILLLLGSVVVGFVYGLGYVAYASIAMIAIGGPSWMNRRCASAPPFMRREPATAVSTNERIMAIPPPRGTGRAC